MYQQGQQLPEPTLGTYIALAVRVGWGLLVLFGIVGIVMGYDAGALVLALTSVMWVSIKILIEALWSIGLWRVISAGKNNEPPDGPAQ